MLSISAHPHGLTWTAGTQHDLVEALVFTRPGHVDLNIINGRLIVQDGKMLTVDVPVSPDSMAAVAFTASPYVILNMPAIIHIAQALQSIMYHSEEHGDCLVALHADNLCTQLQVDCSSSCVQPHLLHDCTWLCLRHKQRNCELSDSCAIHYCHLPSQTVLAEAVAALWCELVTVWDAAFVFLYVALPRLVMCLCAYLH